MGICFGISSPKSGNSELKAALNSSAHDSGKACSRIPAVKNDAWSMTPNISSVSMTGACARQDKYSVHTICKNEGTNKKSLVKICSPYCTKATFSADPNIQHSLCSTEASRLSKQLLLLCLMAQLSRRWCLHRCELGWIGTLSTQSATKQKPNA